MIEYIKVPISGKSYVRVWDLARRLLPRDRGHDLRVIHNRPSGTSFITLIACCPAVREKSQLVRTSGA